MKAKEAMRLALRRLATTASEDAMQCDAEDLVGSACNGQTDEQIERAGEKVRAALRTLQAQLWRRASKLGAPEKP